MRETRFPSFELQGASSDHAQVKISTGIVPWQRVDRISLGRMVLVIFRFKCKITELHQANIRREVIIVFRGELPRYSLLLHAEGSNEEQGCEALFRRWDPFANSTRRNFRIEHDQSSGISWKRRPVRAIIEEQLHRPHSKRQDIKRGDKLVTINRGRQIEVARKSPRTWLEFHLEGSFFAILTPLSASICVPPIVHCTRSFAGTIMSREFEAVCGKYMDDVPMGLDQQGCSVSLAEISPLPPVFVMLAPELNYTNPVTSGHVPTRTWWFANLWSIIEQWYNDNVKKSPSPK
uniref:Uncharacterized protein n=1 Tax=Vespula pensylvanica TaxID=30213 RepID=A0A834NXI5_VESPE|nr:hypothetical protein H0235_010539 [Vespula pensylvanica]